ncbi:MAG: cation transporter [Oscillospiraceae bacterium]|nr:cation transporter [Oscillospiraceae bacterium]
MNQETSRTGEIIRVSIRGIAVNLLLVVFKAVIGLAANSIAIVLDAVNNLSDAISSVITIVGTKLAGKAADQEHPYGHGRVEYISATLIAVLVLLAGLASMKESVVKLLRPEETNYTAVSLLVISGALITKILLGRYYKKKGAALHSDSLSASGTDALFDAVISFATLISAIISMTLGWNLEGILGIIISLFIMKAGYDILSDTVSRIIGIREDDALTKQIRECISENPNVQGAYDLILHNYGPEKYFGSVHIEVDDSMTAREIDALSRSIVPEIYQKFGVILTIGIYATNTHSEDALEIRRAVQTAAQKYRTILQVHGFYIDEAARAVSFDIMLDYEIRDPAEITGALNDDLQAQYPDYSFHINIDRDFSE